jgi:hypothetical protein
MSWLHGHEYVLLQADDVHGKAFTPRLCQGNRRNAVLLAALLPGSATRDWSGTYLRWQRPAGGIDTEAVSQCQSLMERPPAPDTASLLLMARHRAEAVK